MGLPAVSDEHAYALEISGDAMKPAYRDGDVIVVSPGTPIRRGDRVVVKTTGGEVMVKELKRRTAKTLELASLNPAQVDRALAARRGRMDRTDRVGEPVIFPSPLVGEGGADAAASDEGFIRKQSARCSDPSPVAMLRIAPPSPTRGEGKKAHALSSAALYVV